jgi:hypothetical protein
MDVPEADDAPTHNVSEALEDADDAPTYDPGSTLPERLAELARLMRSGEAPSFALVVLGPDMALVDIETNTMPDAQEILLALTLGVQERQRDADEWAMITQMSEASSVPKEDP